jgi:hypothetical protein
MLPRAFGKREVQRARTVWRMLTRRRREGIEEGEEGKEAEEGEEEEEEKQMLEVSDSEVSMARPGQFEPAVLRLPILGCRRQFH